MIKDYFDPLGLQEQKKTNWGTLDKKWKQLKHKRANLPWLEQLASNKEKLSEQTGMSLSERAAVLSGIIPDVRVSESFVRKVYKHAKIRKKKILWTKTPQIRPPEQTAEVMTKAARSIFLAINLPRRLVFVDEC